MPSHASVSPVPSQEIRPLPLHSQLAILTTPLTAEPDGPKHVEYRVYNYRRLRTGRIVRGDGLGVGAAVCIAALAWMGVTAWGQLAAEAPYTSYQKAWLAWMTMTVGYIFIKSRTVLYQSVTPLPFLGLQLSTTRGLSLPYPASRISIPTSTSHTFVPLSDISTVIINEGLRRWSVHYFLAIIKKRGEGVLVAFDRISPPQPVLEEVYHGVRESLFDEYDETPVHMDAI